MNPCFLTRLAPVLVCALALLATWVRAAEPVNTLYIDNGNGTVTNTANGLVWDQTSYYTMAWSTAMARGYIASSYKGAPFSAWRVPAQSELSSLVNTNMVQPSVDTAYFADTDSGFYWTADLASPDHPWCVNFNTGSVYSQLDSSFYHVRLVRSGTPFALAGSAPAGTMGARYPGFRPTGGEAQGGLKWAARGLPAGLYINARSGAVSGTPAAAGTFTVYIGAANAAGAYAQYSARLTINDLPGATPLRVSVAHAGGSTTFTGESASSVALSTPPAHGTVSISGTQILYTPTAGYAGSDGFAYTSSKAGVTSAPAAVSITVNPPAAAVTSVLVDSAVPGALYAGVAGQGIYRSTNGGAQWSAASTQPAHLNVRALAQGGGALYAGTLGGGVFKSVDAGQTWAACAQQPGNLNVTSLVHAASGALYAGGEGGVFFSADGCAHWAALNNGLPN